jgi:hypothetical protein
MDIGGLAGAKGACSTRLIRRRGSTGKIPIYRQYGGNDQDHTEKAGVTTRSADHFPFSSQKIVY